jgi:hypothetical protein
MNASSEIWKQRFTIEELRRQKVREAMSEYDSTVYRPALKALRESCAAIGHIRGKFHDNGIGWTWFYCNQCGARMDIQEYDERER